MENKNKAEEQLLKEIKQLKVKITELEGSEKRMRNLVENVPIGISISTPEGGVVEVNAAILKMFGYDSKEEFVNIPDEDFYYNTKDRERFVKLHKKSFVNGLEIQFKRKDGSEFWSSVTSITITTEAGNTEFINTFEDITERKQAEDTISESEEQFQNLFNSMREGFALCEVICDKNRIPIDYRFLKINLAFQVQSSMDVETTIGKTIKEIYPDVESKWIERYGQVAITQEAIHFVDYNKNTDKYYDVTAYSPSKDKFAMIFKDITQQKKSEMVLHETHERLKISIDNMPNAYILCDTETLVLEWNRTAEKIFGYSKEEILGKNLIDCIVPEKARHLVWDAVKKLKIGEVADYSEKDNNIRKDGKLISCQWSNAPLTDQNGKVFGILFMAQDITERRQIEEELTKHRKQLEEMVVERTKELEDKNKELDNALKVFVGRELTIKNLEERIRALGGK